MNSSTENFGLAIAYLLPGFIVLAGIAPFFPTVALWLQPLDQAQASLGAPVYAVLAAATIGMVLNCFRWLLIDHIHQWTGVKRPIWDDNRLEERLAGFSYVVEQHFRHAQFYGNTLIAVITAYSVNRAAGTSRLFGFGTDTGMLLLCTVLFAGSRDAMSKYYARTIRLIGQISEKGNPTMTNGNHHLDSAGGGVSPKPRPPVRPDSKRPTAPPATQSSQKTSQSQK